MEYYSILVEFTMKKIFAYALAFFLAVGIAGAEESQTLINREVTVKVNGAVCGFCSYGVRKEISKLSFVDTSKYENGILTNSEEQSVTIAVLPGKKVDEDALRKIVIESGYETVSIEYNDK